MSSILTLDQGTTGSTALVVHQDGAVLGRGYREFTQHFPKPGWVEHDADEIVAVTLEAAREALAQAGETPTGIGITNQRETIVVWDRDTMRPVSRAIVWQDRRTAERCRELKAAGLEADVRQRTGLVLDPYFSATKLEWLLRDADLRSRAERGELAFGTIESWLVASLTGGRVHVTDYSNAARTLLFNIEQRTWDETLLQLFGVPRELLPEVVLSSGVVGESDASVLGHSLPIAGLVGDQQGALFGQGCVEAGQSKNTYGTGAFLLMNTGDERGHSESGLLTTLGCGPRGEPVFALEGSVFIAGAAVQWLRDGLQLIDDASETEAMARSVADTNGVHFVPAFVGLGSPHWEPEARGTITGITRGTNRAHLVRATLEAMAFSSSDLLSAMVADAQSAGRNVSIETLRVDGGATNNDWLMQFQADVLDLPVERPDMVETTALGAAGLAGLALGVWESVDDFLAGRKFDRFEPQMSAGEREAALAGWRRAVDATLRWARSGEG
ncbi:MAG: glycerol kinase GlpK [Gemmatimonadales bacterium]